MDITAMIMEHLPFNYTEDNLRAINYFLSSDINALVDEIIFLMLNILRMESYLKERLCLQLK